MTDANINNGQTSGTGGGGQGLEPVSTGMMLHTQPFIPLAGGFMELPTDSPGSQAPLNIVALLANRARTAFLLGASLNELAGRVQVAALDPVMAVAGSLVKNSPLSNSTSKPDITVPLFRPATNSFWLGSIWVMLFNRICELQEGTFPDNSTANTRFDPGKNIPPYLYPTPPAFDYADIGISSFNSEGGVILPDFRLREATRRVLNCLILLYLKPEESLIPDDLLEQQTAGVSAILGEPYNPAPDPFSAPSNPAGPTEGDRQKAIQVLTTQAVRYLNAWDAYLHARFFAFGNSANEASALAAYEAGRAISSLTWDISIQAIPLEKETLDQEMTQSNLGGVWQSAFNESNVSRLQHQISVTGSLLDDLYALETGSSLAEVQKTANSNPDLPSNAVEAVKYSLDYWQRTVVWLNDPRNATAGVMTPELWGQLRQALIEQSNSWKSLVLGEVTLRSFTAENVTKKVLQDVMASFEQVAAQKGIINATAEISKELDAVLKNTQALVTGAVDNLGKTALNEIKTGFGSFRWVLLGVGILGLLGVVVAAITMAQQQSFQPSDLTGVLVTIASAFGLYHVNQKTITGTQVITGNADQVKATVNAGISTVANSVSSANAQPSHGASLTGRLESMFGTAGDAVLEAFEKGYEQIRTDLALLGYRVAVTYPLIEFFVLTESFATIKADYDVMTQIIWNGTDRQEEVMRVAYAAFGPLGAYVGAIAGKNSSDSSASA